MYVIENVQYSTLLDAPILMESINSSGTYNLTGKLYFKYEFKLLYYLLRRHVVFEIC